MRYPPWYKLGKSIPEGMLSKEALQYAGVDWEVEKCNLWVEAEGINRYNLELVATHKGLCKRKKGDTNFDTFITTVGARYKPIQNVEAFKFLDQFQDILRIRVCGSLYNARYAWIVAELEEPKRIAHRDKIERYVLFVNDHEWGGKIQIIYVPLRVACLNTLPLFTAKKDSHKDKQLLKQIQRDYEEIEEDFELLHDTEVELEEEFFIPFINKIRGEKELTKYGLGVLEVFMKILQSSNLKKNTLWTGLNVITEYYDHVNATDRVGSERRMHTLLFRSRAERKRQAFELAKRIAR